MQTEDKIKLLIETLEKYGDIRNWQKCDYTKISTINRWVPETDGFCLAKTVLNIIKNSEEKIDNQL